DLNHLADVFVIINNKDGIFVLHTHRMLSPIFRLEMINQIMACKILREIEPLELNIDEISI
ncbi:MAG: hypothetical protein ACE5I1_14755, partial [bacterium]